MERKTFILDLIQKGENELKRDVVNFYDNETLELIVQKDEKTFTIEQLYDFGLFIHTQQYVTNKLISDYFKEWQNR